ncbi:MAG: hypothetical protein ACE5K7_08525 [Phycisphaerae bacterium]
MSDLSSADQPQLQRERDLVSRLRGRARERLEQIQTSHDDRPGIVRQIINWLRLS